jgi:mono/diheme cytochrome c family protein
MGKVVNKYLNYILRSLKKNHIFSVQSGLIFLIIGLALSGCARERTSENSPIHLVPNMDEQEKYKAQSKSEFFADGATMRPPVEGTVARGQLREDIAYYTGKNAEGEYTDNPKEITMELMSHGRERYDIYCAPCHSKVGDGRGIMIQHEYLPPPSFSEERILKMKDGNLFEIISNGVRNMPSYAHQINVDDRWAIIAYLRALQKSRNAAISDIPIDLQKDIKLTEQQK